MRQGCGSLSHLPSRAGIFACIVLSMPVIAIAGRKGGIGKSTIAGNLAAELDAMGQTVAVLDADRNTAWRPGRPRAKACCHVVSKGGTR